MGRIFQVFCMGMMICGVLFLAMIRHSNLLLFQWLTQGSAPWPQIPNALAVIQLMQWGPALSASLFLSLTAGVMISGCFTLGWAWSLGGKRSFFADRRLMPAVVSAAILFLFMFFLNDGQFSHRVRDYLLLPTSFGRSMVQFYYTYSPMVVNALAPPGGDMGWRLLIRGLAVAGWYIGGPVLVFGGAFLTLSNIIGRLRCNAGYGAGISLVILGLGLCVILYPGWLSSNTMDWRSGLQNPSSRIRIEYLRRLKAKTIPSADQIRLVALSARSSHVAERYWAAKAMGRNPNSGYLESLTALSKDPVIVVAAAAAKSLGRYPCTPQVRQVLMALITCRPEWYVQIAAFTGEISCRP